jgi:protocatechuate 3,4-dioxygenase beta subunit
MRDFEIASPLGLGITRRLALRTLATGIAAVPLGPMLACGDEKEEDAPTSAALEGSADNWASGGTAALRGTTPDPFSAGLGRTCALTCSSILGPCYAATLERRDVTEGQSGLPVRLALLVVDESCTPVAGASVDIWHTSAFGVYSGDDSIEFCNQNHPEALAGRWFRGVQTSGADGRVEFATCFPGWYGGRTIHIHFTVSIGGQESVTSQLYFDDALIEEVLATQPVYGERGVRDTTNANDPVILPAELQDFVLETRRLPDGSLLAWKTLVVRSANSIEACATTDTLGSLPPPGAG